MPKRSAEVAASGGGEGQEAADARLAAALQEAFTAQERPRRSAVNAGLPFAVPEERRVGPRSHTHRFVKPGAGAKANAVPHHSTKAFTTATPSVGPPGRPRGSSGTSVSDLTGGTAASGEGLHPGAASTELQAAPPRALRPPRRADFDKGALVWAHIPGVAVRWPGRVCVPCRKLLEQVPDLLHVRSVSTPPLTRIARLLAPLSASTPQLDAETHAQEGGAGTRTAASESTRSHVG